MNKVILIGRLTRDPELRHTPNGNAVCQITVAIDRLPDQNGQRQADFINVTVWNKQAENVAKYMSKGRLIAVDGRIQTRNYENSEGKRVYVTEVLANTIQFLESKGAGSANNNNSNGGSYNNGYNTNNSFNGGGMEDAMPFDFNSNVASQPIASQSSMPGEMPKVDTVDVEKDPFESFGESIAISDNDLPF